MCLKEKERQSGGLLMRWIGRVCFLRFYVKHGVCVVSCLFKCSEVYLRQEPCVHPQCPCLMPVCLLLSLSACVCMCLCVCVPFWLPLKYEAALTKRSKTPRGAEMWKFLQKYQMLGCSNVTSPSPIISEHEGKRQIISHYLSPVGDCNFSVRRNQAVMTIFKGLFLPQSIMDCWININKLVTVLDIKKINSQKQTGPKKIDGGNLADT